MSLSTNNNLCLPEDVATLQALVREQHMAMAALHAQLQIEKLGRERAELKVKDLLRRMFGPKSEKLNAAQGLLFGVASAAEQAAAVARDALKRARAVIKSSHRSSVRRSA